MKALDNLKTDSATAGVNEIQITEQECGIDKSPIENGCELRMTPGESGIAKKSTPPIRSSISDTFYDARPTIPNPNKAIDNLKRCDKFSAQSVIVYAAPESEAQDGKMRWSHNKDIVMNIVSAALEDTYVYSITQMLRKGRFDHAAVRPRPLKTIFQNQNEAEEFLNRCSKLKAFHDFKDLVFQKELWWVLTYISLYSALLSCTTIYFTPTIQSRAKSMADAWSRDVYQTGCRVVQGRAFVGRPCDSPVWVALYFILLVLQFEFGRSSVSPTVLVFLQLHFDTRDCKTP